MKKKSLLLFSLLFLLSFHAQAEAESLFRLIKRGNRYYKRELYRDALNYYSEGKLRDAKDPVPSFNEGAAYYKMEDYSGSLQSFSRTLELAESEERKSDVYYNLGNNYFKVGDYHKAIETFIKALNINPYDFDAKHNLELAQKRLKEQQKDDQPEEEKSGESRTQKGEDKEKKAQESNEREPRPAQGESDEATAPMRDFTQEEAQRLFESMKSDQTQIIADIIKKRASKEENAKDW